MIEDRLAREMFEDISPKNRAIFFDTMNSIEELEYTYKKHYEQKIFKKFGIMHIEYLMKITNLNF